MKTSMVFIHFMETGIRQDDFKIHVEMERTNNTLVPMAETYYVKQE
jgi:hypothetical protein